MQVVAMDGGFCITVVAIVPTREYGWELARAYLWLTGEYAWVQNVKDMDVE